MKLIDFICIASELKEMIVCDSIGKELSRYDKRNSIDSKYNNEEIMNVTIYNNSFIVYLKM